VLTRNTGIMFLALHAPTNKQVLTPHRM
jgi:hypothetical protein